MQQIKEMHSYTTLLSPISSGKGRAGKNQKRTISLKQLVSSLQKASIFGQ
jgi:hypothetical protein